MLFFPSEIEDSNFKPSGKNKISPIYERKSVCVVTKRSVQCDRGENICSGFQNICFFILEFLHGGIFNGLSAVAVMLLSVNFFILALPEEPGHFAIFSTLLM